MDKPDKRKTFIFTTSHPMNHLKSIAFLLILCIISTTYAVQCPERCNSCRDGAVDCKGRSLTVPPNAYPSDTRIIDLGDNNIRVLGTRTFRRGQTVEVLKLSSNKIGVLRNNAFRSFPRVMSLDLTDNTIARVYPRGLAGLIRLRTLSLSRNRIRRIGTIFRGFGTLQQLNLANNRLPEIRRSDFSSLTRMRYLDLRGNSIASIHPRAFDELTHLRYLFLNNNPIGSAVNNLQLTTTGLQLLDMSNCQLTEVPTALPATVSELRLGNNQIMQINHTAFENVTDLQMLTLNENGLHFLDDGALNHLTELKEIWLRGNNLVYIPRDIPPNVIRLHIDSNRIQDIEQGIFQEDWQLETISIQDNNLRQINPDAFAGLSQLKHINLQRNQLLTLQPRTFADLDNLQTVKLSNNPLQRIEADAFKNLPNLTELSLSYLQPDTAEIDSNFIQEMPSLQKLDAMASPGMGQALVDLVVNFTIVAPSVTKIDLSYNNLQFISEQLRNAFPNADKVLLDGNPFQCTQQLQWLRDWMTSSAVQFHNYEEITCDTPITLRGAQIKTVTNQEFRDGGNRNGLDRSVSQQRSRRTFNDARVVTQSGVSRSNRQEVVPVLSQKQKEMSEKQLALRDERDKRRKRKRRNRYKNGKKRRGGKRGGKRRRKGRKNKRRNGKKRDRKNKKLTRVQG